MSFDLLDQEESDSYQCYIDDINDLISNVLDFVKENKEHELIKCCDKLNDLYNQVNELQDILDSDCVDDRYQIIQDLYNDIDNIYRVMDEKHRDLILSRYGYKMIEKYMEDIDFYYIFYGATKNVEYLICGIKYYSLELLLQTDDI
jgi:hypothetical protein